MKSTIFWIPVEDELPEYDLEVLICDSSDKVTVGRYSKVTGWTPVGVKWWAALPLPPSRVGVARLDHNQLVGWVD